MKYSTEPPYYTIRQVCETVGITYGTYLNWERLGVAPRRRRLGSGRLERVTNEELSRWLQQRDADRQRTGKWHLRRPLARSSESEALPSPANQT